LKIVINTKLKKTKETIAFPLKIEFFEKGKKAIITNKKRMLCFTNFEAISTGVVNLKTS